jgi:hypothetical protein
MINTNKKGFSKLNKDVFGYLLSFNSYGDFPKYMIINRSFVENIRFFIKNKVLKIF